MPPTATDETQMTHIRWKKPDSKSDILYDFHLYDILEKSNYWERNEVIGCQGKGWDIREFQGMMGLF